jgi:uncharacterized protein (UPF0335 family)
MADTPDPICARCGCYESAHGEGGRCEPVGWTFTATDTDTPERELIEKLLQLAHQQADGTDFHKGRKLTAEDTMYFVAARKIKALLSRVDKLEERVRALEDEIVDLWHESEAGRKELHECLGMTAEEYARWANPDALNKNAS